MKRILESAVLVSLVAGLTAGSSVFAQGSVGRDGAYVAGSTSSVPVIAGGSGPQISLTPASISGSADAGASTTQTLTIGNAGSATLTWTLTEETNRHFPAPGSRPEFPVTHPNTEIATLKRLPQASDDLPASQGIPLPAGASTAYAVINNVNDYVSLVPTIPGTLTSIGVASGSVADVWGGGFVSGDDTVHYLLGDSGLLKYTVATRVASVINASTGSGDVWAATIDPTSGKMYWIGPSGSQRLYSADLTTGTSTLIGTITGSAAGNIINGLAADASGNLWATDKTANTLVAIDKATAASSAIGALGIDTEAVASLAFDNDGALYFATPLAGGGTVMYRINTSTGAATSLGTVPSQLEAMAFRGGTPAVQCVNPADVPWLSLSPISGSTSAGSTTSVTVGLNATSLAAGTYSAKICASSNDAANPVVSVPVSFTVTPPAGGSNGIISSGALNHAIAQTVAGTSLNIVTSALDNSGPLTSGWDFNFWQSGGNLVLWKVGGSSDGQYAVDGSGNALLLQPGDVVGPATAFSSGASGTVQLVPAWRAGTDGYLGVRFNCDGRLTYPVAGVCYGYIHMSTTASSGFPATILDTAFDGDNQPIVIGGGSPPLAPVAQVTPAAGFDFTVEEGSAGTDVLVVSNVGGGMLNYTIAESNSARQAPTSYKSANDALANKHNLDGADPQATLSSANWMGAPVAGRPVELMAGAISQMADNSPGSTGVACTNTGTGATRDNSWWRRFYFNEHANVTATAHVQSVTISTGSQMPSGGLPSTINLYTIPHSTTVDTIPTSQLTLIGSATTTVTGPLSSVTIPVIGTIDDTVGKDLVVEWNTPGSDSGLFYPGANATPETHPTFLSSVACSITQPTSAMNIGGGFPDFHLTMVVQMGDGPAAGGNCQNLLDIPWLSASPASGSVAGGASNNVAVNVTPGALGPGIYEASLCVNSNDPANPRIEVPVIMTVEVSDTIFKDGFDTATVFTQPILDPSFEATVAAGDDNPYWNSTDSASDGTVFYQSGPRTGTYAIWFGGWRRSVTQDAKQSVTLVGGGPRYLTYWRNIGMAPVGAATLRVYVDGTIVETTDVLASGVDGGYVKRSIDITSFANNAAREIRFEYVATGTDDGNVFVDDVAIEETP